MSDRQLSLFSASNLAAPVAAEVTRTVAETVAPVVTVTAVPPVAPVSTATPVAAAPTAPNADKPTWAMLEGEYVTFQWQKRRRLFQNNVAVVTRQLAEHRLPMREIKVKDIHLALWREDLARSEAFCPDAWDRDFRGAYIPMVKAAIKKGEPVPPEVLAQYPEFALAATARARYDKGKRTSFGNKTAGVDYTPQATRGYKVKRQDGKPILPEQKADIARGMDEIEAALGQSLADINWAFDVTIAHTNSRRPFMTKHAGLFVPKEFCISVGVVGLFGPFATLAHEWGHYLDHVAGYIKTDGKGRVVFSMTGDRKKSPTTSLAEVDWWGNPAPPQAISQARRSFAVTQHEIERHRKQKIADDMPLPEKARLERCAYILPGKYWSEPCEVWARLFEQYVSTKLGNPVGAWSVETNYPLQLGYWPEDTWATLEPLVAEEIKRRLTVVREAVKAAGCRTLTLA